MLLKLYILQCMSVWVGASVIEQSRGFFGDHFSNMEINDENIYIGAKDYIYVLHASDLSSKETVSTCTGDCKSNINKVLLVNKGHGQLIACGTGFDGSCEIRNLSSIETLVSRSSADGSNLIVSTDENRPATFVQAPNSDGLYAGVTYGPGIETISASGPNAFSTYNFYLANYTLLNNQFEIQNHIGLSLSKPDDYVIYFKGGFHHNKFVYFVTNQKLKVGNFSYTSKLIRLCQNDVNFQSYTDIILECKDGDNVYNLIQDISIFEPGEELRDNLTSNGTVLAATFASGSDPEHPQQPSAVCLYKLEDIDRNVMIAKRKYIVCPGTSFNTDERYLFNNIPRNQFEYKQCINESKYVESYVECNTDFGSFTYVTGDEQSALNASAVYTYSSTDQDVYLNKLQAGTTGKYTFLHIGTSDGKLQKVNVNSAEGVLYEEKIVDQGHTITGIHIEDDGKLEYVMSTRKIVRYETVNCSMYTTCQETMDSRNPLCGWCVFENMSTLKENNSCPNQIRNGHWLSSLTECLSLRVDPGAVPINSGVVEVEVTANVLPDLLDFDVQCEFTVGSFRHINGARSVIGNTVKCRTPLSSEHTDGTLGLLAVSGSNKILLAETSFLFYDCDHYTLCSECAGDPRAKCYWDSIRTMCISTPSGNIVKAGDCPKFQDDTDKHYIPAGISKTLTFNVANLANSSSMEYRCRLSPTSATVIAQKVGDNQIKCDLLGPISDVPMVEYSVEILYGSSRLDNMNSVEVYSCDLLGTDCSVCGSLMYININYECKWCSSTCQYPIAQCSDPCSAPSVQQVLPNTAAINSSITVTIVGKQLGARYEDVQSIRLADVPCDPKPDRFIPSRRVTCTVQGPAVVKSGNVVVMVNNQSSQGSVPFSFKEPVISKLMPASGPKSGGTRITLSGDDLGVGTRHIKVYITDSEGHKLECTNPKVEPDIGLVIISSSPFTIECDTPPNNVDVMLNMIEVVFDGSTTVSQSINFTYVEDPIIADITRKAITSGGNIQSVTGQNLKNAHKGYITGNGKRIYCTFKSETKMDCPALPLSPNHKKDLLSSVNSSSAEGLTVEIIVHLDGVKQTFTIMYYVDPEFDKFDEEVKLFESRQQKLTIKGRYLNLVAEKWDVRVSVGMGSCEVIDLTENNLTCVPPLQQPATEMAGATYPEVNVSIGNVLVNLGYLQYVVIHVEEKLDTKLSIMIGAISACVVVIVMIAAFVVYLKCKKSRKSDQLRHDKEQEIEVHEMKIRQMVREESEEESLTRRAGKRLATHYQATTERREPLRLFEIYAHCELDFKAHNIIPPSKDLISKIIPSLFNTEKCIVYSGGDKSIAFFGIAMRDLRQNQATITVPESCTASTNGNGDIQITCWREFKVNGNHLKVDVLFGRDYTTLSCRGVSHNLSWGLRPCQSNIEGMVYIMENLKICKGFLVEEGVDGNMYEVWVDVSDGGNKECRVRAHHCKNILSFCGTVDCCETCSKKSRRATKRISAREELENAPPNKIHKNPVDTKDCVLDSESLQKLLNEGAPEQLHLLLRMQLENSRPGLEKHQRKWDPEFISFCLSIYVKSPRVYSDLRNSKMLILPSESLLRMYKNCVKQKPGLCDDNLIWMEKEAKRQNVSAFGKRGGLVIDEMSIQDDLQVVRKGDAWCIVGGVDMGETNNLLSIISNKGKKAELATHCLQLIFHGLSGFRWPVAYYGSNPATTHQIFINFWECVDALDEHGFTVDYVMLDGASTNRAFMNMLLNDRARGSDYTTTDIYKIDHKVFIIQDSKHVIKRIRNSIESSKMANRAAPGRHLSLDDQPIVWEHFEDAYAFNQQSGLRIHRHLTKEHIELTSASKMRNRLAEQVLDKDMLFLMKSYQATVNEPERLSATIQLLEKTSVLVEFFGDTRPICDPWDKRVKELDDILNFFCKWESCIQKSVKYTPAKHLFPQETRDDINSAIVGFQNLCRSLLGRGDSITPAYVNSDVVENHFCQQRGICNGLNTNPTLAQYGPSNTSICLSQTSVSSKRNASTKALNFRATTPCPLNTRR